MFFFLFFFKVRNTVTFSSFRKIILQNTTSHSYLYYLIIVLHFRNSIYTLTRSSNIYLKARYLKTIAKFRANSQKRSLRIEDTLERFLRRRTCRDRFSNIVKRVPELHTSGKVVISISKHNYWPITNELSGQPVATAVP